MRLHHPNLPNQVIEIPDDEDAAAVFEKGGWIRDADPVQANPALAPGEVETKPTKTTGKKADSADD